MKDRRKSIEEQVQWGDVSVELEQESLKLQSYDHTLLPLLGDVKGKRVLDYGAGPGMLASVLAKRGADVKAFDICQRMRELAGEKIGAENIYSAADHIPEGHFDLIICNLVLCIVPDEDVAGIAQGIWKSLKSDGLVYVGFCNPRIYDVPESQLDLRMRTGNRYGRNHVYKKIKKEGGYEILEMHRPIGWYVDMYQEAGLEVLEIMYTPEYELNGRRIQDFVLFRLSKGGGKR